MRGRKVKSRSAHRAQLKPRRMLPSWCKECFMLRGKSLARHPWPAVMDLPSEVHVHSHGRSCTEIAADDDDDNINILASSIFCNKNFQKWNLLPKVTHFEAKRTASKCFCSKRGETTFETTDTMEFLQNFASKIHFWKQKNFLTNWYKVVLAKYIVLVH